MSKRSRRRQKAIRAEKKNSTPDAKPFDRAEGPGPQNPDLVQKAPGSDQLPNIPAKDPFDYTQTQGRKGLIGVELPIAELQQWSVPNVLRAMQAHDNGQFQQSALLCDTTLTDPRIRSAFSTRTKAITGLPIEFKPANDSAVAQELAAIAAAEWTTWVSEPEAEEFHRWFLMMGFALGQIIWLTDQPRWQPRFNVWHPSNMFWYWDGYNRNFGRWQLVTTYGLYEPLAGDGQWVFGVSSVKLGWIKGLIRSIALRYLARLYAVKSWARFNEKYGLALLKIIAPAEASEKEIRQMQSQVATLNAEPQITLRQGAKTEGNIWDVGWEEVTATGYQTFQETLKELGEEIAIDVLGQNLTSRMPRGGSYAAARVHQDVRHDLVEADAKALSTIWRQQLLRPWATFIAGDPDLAPVLVYNTEPPPDVDTKTKSLAQFAQAIKNLQDAGVPVQMGPVNAVPLIEDLGLRPADVTDTVNTAARPTQDDAVEVDEGTSG